MTGHFVTRGDDVYCANCTPECAFEDGSPFEVWEEYSDGWIAPCICATCKLSIPVYVDG